MDRWIKVAMKVDPALAKKIAKEGEIEVVTRLGDGKFDTMTKVPVKKDSKAISALRAAKFGLVNPNSVLKLLKWTAIMGTTKITTEFFSSMFMSSWKEEIMAKLEEISTQVKGVKRLGYLNTGIGLVNLGVEVAGILYIRKRLDEVQKDIEKLSNKISQVKNILTSEKLSEYQNLSMRFGSATNGLSHGDSIDRYEIDKLLIDMRTFSGEMIRNFYSDAMDAEIILEIVFNLLAAYTALLNIYIREYYFDKGRFPDNLESYTSLFDELTDDRFSKLVQDYLVVKKGMSIIEAINAIQVQKLLVANCMLQYKDQLDILNIVETKDKYLSLMKITDKYVESEIERLIPKVAEETGDENCREVIQEALGVQLAV